MGGSGFKSGGIFSEPSSGGATPFLPRLYIGSIAIGKDLIGGTGFDSGSISAQNFDSVGGLERLTIKGSVIGGSGESSGSVSISADVGIFAIGGSLIGSTGRYSGSLSADNFDAITIGGSLLGGGSLQAGSIFATDTGIDLLKIRGDVRGSTGESSGRVNAGGQIDLKIIGGAIIRGTGTDSGTVG